MPTQHTQRIDPTLDAEGALFDAGAKVVIGCDEVGRGAIAGPVTVGMAMLATLPATFPTGLRDSKMMSAKKRELVDPAVQEWTDAWAFGDVPAHDIDHFGIMWALGEAACQALTQLECPVDVLAASVVILDGSFDWLTPALNRHHASVCPVVRVRPKADRDCASVAAASVIAKVHRDRLMMKLAELPQYAHYQWGSNKGYGSVAHRNAIAENGPSDLHRMSWLHPVSAKEPLG